MFTGAYTVRTDERRVEIWRAAARAAGTTVSEVIRRGADREARRLLLGEEDVRESAGVGVGR